ncbi:hypothetical protein OG361_00800 [Streptomyces sp. NBC_00090]|uniref:hypothetical protein n=1 Tax=Streptomyces sp. NBC_00090 TaxID=2903619 RepID=UPI00324619C8
MTTELSALSAATSGGRAALADRLEADGPLARPGLRAALLHVRNEVLLPRAYTWEGAAA